MTSMSRFFGGEGGGGGLRSAPAATFSPWHVGCCLLGSGCLYLAPIEQMPRNSPPEIVYPPSDQNTLELIADVERARVTVVDPDGDVPYFVWSGVPADVEIPPDPPIVQPQGDEDWWTSIYEVPRDKRLDGRTVRVFVTDGEEGVEVEWLVQVEE